MSRNFWTRLINKSKWNREIFNGFRISFCDIPIGNLSVDGSTGTMTNTLTSDTKKTINQIKKLELAGADLIRVSIPDKESSIILYCSQIK